MTPEGMMVVSEEVEAEAMDVGVKTVKKQLYIRWADLKAQRTASTVIKSRTLPVLFFLINTAYN